ncbi:ABC transporter ATP-binding protein [Embleya sp. NPDC050154]|uniref:ABC transporter ATP-binding protein n=1 Tax=Embleya sp. NPDC050154 TaxID=3363988 RepID=UPI003796F698
MLSVLGLRKRYGEVVALNGFELDVEAGEIVGLVGHNGAGKTTFARAVAALIRVDAGEVRIDGRPVTPRRRMPHELGIAPQELALFPTTALQNLRYAGRLYGLGRRLLAERIEEIAEALGLTEILPRPVEDLSGGQQRRLHAAAAMLHRPRVLLLDEPTVGADPVTRELLLRAVRSMADQGAAVVYTTHYLPELEVLDATLAVADHGRVIARGARADLLAALPGRVTLTFADGGGLCFPHGLRDDDTRADGDDVVITAIDPAAAAARLLAANPEHAARLRSIALDAPTLDDLYRELLTRNGA